MPGAASGQAAGRVQQQIVKSNVPGNYDMQSMYPMLSQILSGGNQQQMPDVNITIPRFGPKANKPKSPQLSDGYRRMLANKDNLKRGI